MIADYCTLPIKNLDLDKICRVCLTAKKDMRPLFSEMIASMLMDCARVQVAETDGWPDKICLQCVHQVSRCHSFKMRVEKSDAQLRDYIKGLTVIVEEQAPPVAASPAKKTPQTTPTANRVRHKVGTPSAAPDQFSVASSPQTPLRHSQIVQQQQQSPSVHYQPAAHHTSTPSASRTVPDVTRLSTANPTGAIAAATQLVSHQQQPQQHIHPMQSLPMHLLAQSQQQLHHQPTQMIITNSNGQAQLIHTGQFVTNAQGQHILQTSAQQQQLQQLQQQQVNAMQLCQLVQTSNGTVQMIQANGQPIQLQSVGQPPQPQQHVQHRTSADELLAGSNAVTVDAAQQQHHFYTEEDLSKLVAAQQQRSLGQQQQQIDQRKDGNMIVVHDMHHSAAEEVIEIDEGVEQIDDLECDEIDELATVDGDSQHDGETIIQDVEELDELHGEIEELDEQQLEDEGVDEDGMIDELDLQHAHIDDIEVYEEIETIDEDGAVLTEDDECEQMQDSVGHSDEGDEQRPPDDDCDEDDEIIMLNEEGTEQDDQMELLMIDSSDSNDAKDKEYVAEFISMQTSRPEPGKYVCNLCRQEFRQIRVLNAHMKSHSNWIKANCKKMPKCPICGRTFKGPGMLRMHMKTHEEKPVNQAFCKLCNKEFKTKTILYRHRQTHYEKYIQCVQCLKCFSTIGQLQSHQNKKQHPKVFKCSHCNAIFENSAMLKEHITSFLVQHNDEEDADSQNSLDN